MGTLNLSKSYDFFKPESVREQIHIIGCGSVGATVTEMLVRFGLTKFTLYDFDIVKPHNLANQIFTQQDIGQLKVDALAGIIKEINPAVKLNIMPKGYEGQRLGGYVFLCVDNIELRKEIVLSHKDNPYIKAMFDFRTRLTDAQHYAASWNSVAMVKDLIKSMDFTHVEAMAETPVSACNITPSVAPTVRIICALGVTNFINYTKGCPLKKFIQMDAFNFVLDAF